MGAMPNILVVDDSAVDRRLVGGLIEKDPDLSVTFAANGTHALTMMRQAVPALVLTDLIMPEMNGLQLVKAIREQHPFVPVILMTSKGNEEIAVQAQKGRGQLCPQEPTCRNVARYDQPRARCFAAARRASRC